MAVEVKVPAMGESITSGILASWRVKDGENVSEGQAIYDLETDKITMEGVASAGGVIEIKVEEGAEVEIGQVVALIKETGGAPKPGPEEGARAKEPGSHTEPPAETPQADEKRQEGPQPQSGPAVRRLAEEKGVDLANIQGSGKGGRVTKGDVLQALEQQSDKPQPDTREPAQPPAPRPVAQPQTSPAQASAPKADSAGRTTRKKMTPLRKRVAERLVQAQQQAAILTTFNECDMSQVMNLRKQHQDRFVEQHGIKLGFMSFFVKAAVQALKSVPAVNAQIEGDEIIENHFYDIGVAVSTPRGLMVPVVRDADKKSFAQIEKDIADYGKKAKEGKISIDDLQGGVFTISNGGIFGSLLSTPIINPPQSGILGMHSIQERPVARDGQVVIRPMMYLALSYDHRLVDGREAVTFLVKIKEAIEDPARMLFEI